MVLEKRRLIYFLRHTESQFNADPINGNTVDCGLTNKGVEQAKQIEGTYDLVIISPLKRAQQTFYHSNIVAKRIEIWDEVREVVQSMCDILEGEEFKDEIDKEVLARISRFRNKLNGVDAERILVVTHADFVWWLTSKMVKEDGERYGTWLGNGEIHLYKLDVQY